MKIILSVMLSIVFLVNVEAQEANFFTNSDEAIEFAKAQEGKILMVFGGSDWCRPCKQFKKEILDSVDFQEATSKNTAILYLDFPSKKKNKLTKSARKHNENLAAKYNTSGSFPKIILMDHEMNKIKEILYENQSSSDFISLLQ